MLAKFILSAHFTRILWVCTLLVFTVAEMQVIVSYFRMPGPHSSFGIGHLLATVLIVSVPGIAGLRGYSVARALPLPATSDQVKLVWVAREFLVISIAAYVAIAWRAW